MKLFDDFVSFVPRIAYRGTFYDDGGIAPLDGKDKAISSDSNFGRSIIEGGATFAARGEAWVNENWLHMVEPYFDILAQEAYISGDDDGARAYVFDALDASRTWEDHFAGRGRNLPYSWYGFTPGLRNEWSKVDEKGTLRTIIDFDVYAAVQLNSACFVNAPSTLDNDMHKLPVSGKPSYGEGNGIIVPGARLRYSPEEDILLTMMAEYDSDNDKIALADLRFSQKVSEDFSWYAMYSLRDHRLWDFASSPYNKSSMSEDIFNDLCQFQISAIKTPFESGKEIECDHNFYEYFRNVGTDGASPLENRKTKYTFTAPKTYDNWVDFAKETVWYGRRKGATLYTNNINQTKIEII
jgi:hypothetical protein